MKVHVWRSGTYTGVGIGLGFIGYSFLSPNDPYDPKLGIAIALLNAQMMQSEEITEKWLKSVEKNGIVHTEHNVDEAVVGAVLDVIKEHAIAQAKNRQKQRDYDRFLMFVRDYVDFDTFFNLLTRKVGRSQWSIKESWARELNNVANHYTKVLRELQ